MKTLYILLTLFLLSSCTDDFLEEKSKQSLLVPNSLEDFQLLLDNNGVMNVTPGLGLVASDDLEISDNGFHNSGLSLNEQSAYLRDVSSFSLISNGDWKTAYEQIFYCNIVLDGLKTLNIDDEQSRRIKGSALFYRGYAMFGLLQFFAKPYLRESAQVDLSVPLALSSDVNKDRPIVVLQQAYDQLITDLEDASSLLVEKQNNVLQPTKLAALSLLGRTYLLMSDYKKAEEVIENAMTINSDLLDYNLLDKTAKRPFPALFPEGPGNVEIVYYSPFFSYMSLLVSLKSISVNDELVKSYQEDDLRKDLYFEFRADGTAGFKGSYAGSIRKGELFSGLTIDENYLNYAEVLTRNGKVDKAHQIMNTFLKTRFRTGKYIPFENMDSSATLKFILDERRKSLVGKGTRWFDIRRFINDKDHFISAKKIVDNVSYELVIGDQRVVFPFPVNEK